MPRPHRRPSAAAAILLAAILAAGLTTGLAVGLTPAPAAAQSAAELRGRVNSIERELADIRARLGVPAGETANGPLSEVLVRLDSMEEQIRKLTGKVEELQHTQRRIAEDAAKRFGDVDFRLTELEGGDTSKLAPVPPLGGVDSQASASAQAGVSVSERNDLDRAIDHVRHGRYDIAQDRLRNFLNTYPHSPLEGEALYWLGQSQFLRGAYQDAARSYLRGYKANPKGPAAPENLYRLGVALGKLGQTNEACLTLKEVPRQFPQGPADVLKKAKDASDALSCG